ncbi:Acyl-CoA Delta(11) desaturase [Lucilia cuprina]|nr:Acyl-CoA Delta(11) desaturase [Lucilia cuprina]
MPPNAAPASQTITESLLAAGGISEGNPKVLTEATTGVLFEQDAETIDGGLVKDIEKLKKAEKRKLKLVWRNIIAFGYLHLAALYGAYLICTSAKWQTIAFENFQRKFKQNMDAFKVPKKVNRHVLKALNFLSQGKAENEISTEQILNQVKYQMRNLVPVYNIDMVIQKSLKNLSDIGLIDRTAPQRFAMGRSYAPSSAPKANKPKTVNPNIFKPNVSRKRSISKLNPNFKRAQYDSEESMSGEEYDHARKRIRTNTKKIIHSGRNTELPKARQHFRFKNIALADPLSDPSPLYMRDFESDGIFEQNQEMAVYIGPIGNTNNNLDVTNITPIEPLEINEILNDDQTDNINNSQITKEASFEVVELFLHNNNNYETANKTNSQTNSQSDDQPSKTSVDTNVSTNEKSKTSVSATQSQTITLEK